MEEKGKKPFSQPIISNRPLLPLLGGGGGEGERSIPLWQWIPPPPPRSSVPEDPNGIPQIK